MQRTASQTSEQNIHVSNPGGAASRCFYLACKIKICISGTGMNEKWMYARSGNMLSQHNSQSPYCILTPFSPIACGKPSIERYTFGIGHAWISVLL